jgi:NADH dehydrogenase FAD-containing subunit
MDVFDFFDFFFFFFFFFFFSLFLSFFFCSSFFRMLRSRICYEKIVVLGSGWAGFKILQSFKHPSHELICVSVNNHFLFTPLLTTTTVGTLEFRGISEPTMSIPRLNRFIHAAALSVDASKKTVHCRSVYDVAKVEGGERYFPEFDVAFDKVEEKNVVLLLLLLNFVGQLVIACGARAATFGVPGVKEWTFPLRQLVSLRRNDPTTNSFFKKKGDARAIRSRLIEVFERASSEYIDESERQRLLSFVIVGAGPTSVEFAAELYDFLRQDVVRLFPSLAKKARVVMVEAGNRVLGSFSKNLSDYVKKLYETRNITLILNKSVKAVHQHHLELSDGEELRFGLCVWVRRKKKKKEEKRRKKKAGEKNLACSRLRLTFNCFRALEMRCFRLCKIFLLPRSRDSPVDCWSMTICVFWVLTASTQREIVLQKSELRNPELRRFGRFEPLFIQIFVFLGGRSTRSLARLSSFQTWRTFSMYEYCFVFSFLVLFLFSFRSSSRNACLCGWSACARRSSCVAQLGSRCLVLLELSLSDQFGQFQEQNHERHTMGKEQNLWKRHCHFQKYHELETIKRIDLTRNPRLAHLQTPLSRFSSCCQYAN